MLRGAPSTEVHLVVMFVTPLSRLATRKNSDVLDVICDNRKELRKILATTNGTWST